MAKEITMRELINKLQGRTRSTIWKLYVFEFLREMGFFGAVLVPFFTEWGGIGLVQVQILQSWFMFWIFILEVPTGAIADFLGRKYSIALGAFTVSLAALIYGSVPRFEVFLLGELLFGAAMALYSGADRALLYDTLKEEGKEELSKHYFGRIHAIHLAGIMVAAPIGGLIAAKMGLNYPMVLSAIPYLLAGLVALTIREPEVRERVSERKRYIEIIKRGLVYFYSHPKLRGLAIDAVLVATAAYFVIWLYQPLLREEGFPIAYFGLVHALMVGVEILIAANFSRFDKLVGSSKRYLVVSAALTAGAFVIAAVFPSVVTGILLVIIGGGFGLTRLEYVSAVMNKFIPSEERATVLSSFSMLRRLALVVLNPVVGIIADGSLGYALGLVGILPILAIGWLMVRKDLTSE